MKLFANRRADRDLSERYQELHDRMAAISRSQAVIAFNLDGTIIEANENFLSATGYSQAEVQGRHHSIFMDPGEAQGAAYKDFWRNLNQGQFVAGKFRRMAMVWRRLSSARL